MLLLLGLNTCNHCLCPIGERLKYITFGNKWSERLIFKNRVFFLFVCCLFVGCFFFLEGY